MLPIANVSHFASRICFLVCALGVLFSPFSGEQRQAQDAGRGARLSRSPRSTRAKIKACPAGSGCLSLLQIIYILTGLRSILP